MKNPCARLKKNMIPFSVLEPTSPYLFDFLTICFISLYNSSSNFFSRFGTSLFNAQNCTSRFCKFHFVTRINSSILEIINIYIMGFIFIWHRCEVRSDFIGVFSGRYRRVEQKRVSKSRQQYSKL